LDQGLIHVISRNNRYQTKRVSKWW